MSSTTTFCKKDLALTTKLLSARVSSMQSEIKIFHTFGDSVEWCSEVSIKLQIILFLWPFTWVKVFRINPEFRILRLTFHRKSASKC